MNPSPQKPVGWARRRRLLLIGALFFLFIALASTLFFAAESACRAASHNRIFRSTSNIPQNEVALVLGTSKTTRSGRPNLHFNQRIEAAAALYRAGKVKYLLVSGDNHVKGYDEPSDMRDALIAAGVPSSAITRDYAGFRTLDSVVRAKSVFGLSQCTIVTEEFHCARAVWIAHAHGIDAVAYAAPDVKLASWSLRADAREHLARAWCALDLYVLNRGPKFSGPREPILLSSNQ